MFAFRYCSTKTPILVRVISWQSYLFLPYKGIAAITTPKTGLPDRKAGRCIALSKTVQFSASLVHELN